MPRLVYQVVLDLPDSVPGYASPELAARMILRDALSEFANARYPVEDYVRKRYPWKFEPVESARLEERRVAQVNEKIEQVKIRVEAAHKASVLGRI